MKKRALFIFRRDLRLDDNSALIAAHQAADEVLPVFFFDPRQLSDHPFRSLSGMQFLFESLADLEQQLTKKTGTILYCHEAAEKMLPLVLEKYSIDSVFSNRDYTPFSKKRDAALLDICKRFSISFQQFDDALLTAPGEVLKDDGKPYTVYTPFSKKALKGTFKKPVKHSAKNFVAAGSVKSQVTLAEIKSKYLPTINEHLHVRGGRKNALRLLQAIPKLENYQTARDFPSEEGTTGLSAHNKFGTVSPREICQTIEESLGRSHTLIKELLWRDFFCQIANFFPHVFEGSYHRKYDAVEWDTPGGRFKAWQEGKTGFPIVDAGMRQLKETGYMHNRVRMIVASFLTKDLHISWREGEKHFARHLVDYDPAVNNGNWQWAASTGCDAQPYFRIFNPWLQQERFDNTYVYIKKWVLELRDVPNKLIKALAKGKGVIPGYVAPIIVHSVEKTITERRYSAALSKTKKS